ATTFRFSSTPLVLVTSWTTLYLLVETTLPALNSVLPTCFGALVQQKYGHSWSDGITTESQVDLDVPPGSYGQIYVQYPEY
ncbi:hypothetical protein C6A88_00440, partial [Mycolicibacterium austroafricanum]